MPSTYAHNAIGGETEKAKGTEKEKAGKTVDGREKVDRTSEKVGKTTDRKKKREVRHQIDRSKRGLDLKCS